MAKYCLTSKAVEDLSKIWDYTYEVWLEKQADKYYELLINAFQEISEHPEIGKNYYEIESATLGLGVGTHIMFYRVMKPNEVEILMILHQE